MTLPFLAVLLFAAGVALLAAESFLPGFGIVGVLGCIALVAGIVVCFLIGRTTGVAVLAVTAVVGPLAVAGWVQLLPHTPLARRIVLPTPRPTPCEEPVRLGQTGVAVSELRPGGVCEFDGDLRLPATSERGVIPRGTPVRVIACEHGRAVVRAVS